MTMQRSHSCSATETARSRAAPAVPLAAATAAIVTADFNGDGNADLALVNDLNNTLIILSGDGHRRLHRGCQSESR